MLSADYSQLFASGIRMLSSNRSRRASRRMSAPPPPPPQPTTLPAHGASYISFEPDTPLPPSPSRTTKWRKALRRISFGPAAAPSPHTTQPAAELLSAHAHDTTRTRKSTSTNTSGSTNSSSSSRSFASTEKSGSALDDLYHAYSERPHAYRMGGQPAVYYREPEKDTTAAPARRQRASRPAPALYIVVPAAAPSTKSAGTSAPSPLDFLSLSATSTEFGAEEGSTPVGSSAGAVDWRRFHDEVRWEALG